MAPSGKPPAATALLLACCGALLPWGVGAGGLRDNPIEAAGLLRLDGDGWTARRLSMPGFLLQGVPMAPTADLTIKATVPGDLITDLQKAGLIGDPLYENNFLNASLWADPAKVWEYSRTFDAPQQLNGDGEVLLVFDGVKMGATVELNDVQLGHVTDQHVRYTFPVSSVLKGTQNVLKVRFDGTSTDGRYMACSGGWDWAPISNTFEGLDHTFSKGIWKHVYLTVVPPGDAAIMHVVPHTFFLGSHATAPLADGNHGGFQVKVRVHLFGGPHGATSNLVAKGSWGAEASSPTLTVAEGDERAVEVTLNATASQVKLWWPVGYGGQPLYHVNVSFGSAKASRRIGFRVAAIVTSNDTDTEVAARAKDEEGSGTHGLYFRVNGAAIMAFGSNMIPMDEMEGRYSAEAHRQVLISARDGRMNFIRIWGGGVFLPEEFYDAADEMGLLVYQDMMYTTTSQTHQPKGLAAEVLEIQHNVRRLASHPSIIVWNSCNECKAGGLYTSFVMTHVAAEDKSRPIWPACPSAGWSAGVRKLDSLPTGGELKEQVPNSPKIESHGPYDNGNGFAAVNQGPAGSLLIRDPRLPIPVAEAVTGLGQPNLFASEFGASVFSSFESMSPTLAKNHWGVHGGMPADDCSVGDTTTTFWKTCKGGNPMAQRNYPCDDLIIGYFGNDTRLEETGEVAFKRQLWQCMVAQALDVKSNIEVRRSTNSFGVLTWQLNEIWPTGGWGSLEYGTLNFTDGQVLGGRWRPLHHFFVHSLYRQRMATCGVDGLCYFKNDDVRPFAGYVVIRALDISNANGNSSVVKGLNVSLPGGPGQSRWFRVARWSKYLDGNHVFQSTVHGDSGVESSHVILPMVPAKLKVVATKLTVKVGEPAADGSVPVTVTSSAPALYVTLTTAAQGRFSDNVFLMFDQLSTTVNFLPFELAGPLDLKLLKSSTRVEDLYANLMHKPAAQENAVFV